MRHGEGNLGSVVAEMAGSRRSLYFGGDSTQSITVTERPIDAYAY
jgi:hypothetical protein